MCERKKKRENGKGEIYKEERKTKGKETGNEIVRNGIERRTSGINRVRGTGREGKKQT